MENKKLLFHIPRENKEDFQSIMNSVDMNELYKAEDKMKQLEYLKKDSMQIKCYMHLYIMELIMLCGQKELRRLWTQKNGLKLAHCLMCLCSHILSWENMQKQ